MSGPHAADVGQLYTHTAAEVAMWPLAFWSDEGQATIECAACDDGVLLTARVAAEVLLIADLTARVEAHMQKCPGRGRGEGRSS